MSDQLNYNGLIWKKATDFGNICDGSLPRSRENFSLSPFLPPVCFHWCHKVC
ncbi:hypothetical protein AXF42_Ash005234 [Apostasia shenzhenica]|uniref:Uncharacterized protein n=1 Tax=Apostasia shenzhenica TaxID=1088818 RepID=A0A2I0B6B9_9ASPA|nr:hypothetical protein AXF42_Ash005234 [Apostasia shenzhenica]